MTTLTEEIKQFTAGAYVKTSCWLHQFIQKSNRATY